MTKTWQVILATVAIFVAGLVTGAAFTLGAVRWMVRHHQQATSGLFNPQGRGANGQPQQVNPQLFRKIMGQLDLTPEQREKIEPIVKRTAAQLQRDRREAQLNAALLLEKAQDEISEVLTPEQRVKFEDMVSRARERLQQFRRNLQQNGQPQNPPPAPAAQPGSN